LAWFDTPWTRRHLDARDSAYRTALSDVRIRNRAGRLACSTIMPPASARVGTPGRKPVDTGLGAARSQVQILSPRFSKGLQVRPLDLKATNGAVPGGAQLGTDSARALPEVLSLASEGHGLGVGDRARGIDRRRERHSPARLEAISRPRAPALEVVDRVGLVSVVPAALDDWDAALRVSRYMWLGGDLPTPGQLLGSLSWGDAMTLTTSSTGSSWFGSSV
jgi:hypothetical protein